MGSIQPLRYSQTGILLAAIVLLGIFALAFQTVRSFRTASNAVLRHQELRVLFSETSVHLKDVTNNTRAYLTNGDERLLPVQRQNAEDLKRSIAEVQRNVTDDPVLIRGVERYSEVVRELLAALDSYIALRREKGLPAVTARLAGDGEAKRLGDELRVVGNDLQNHLAEQIKSPLKTVHQDTTLTLTVLGSGIALAIVLVATVVFVLRRDYRMREEAAAVLRQHADEIKDLYNRAPCGYHSLDAGGRFVAINDTELTWLGYTREEMIGKMAMTDLLTPAAQENFRAGLAQLKAGQEVRDLEVELRRKDGSVFPASLNGSAIHDAQGRFVATRTTLFDLTERKRIERITEQARVFAENIFDTIREPIVILSHDLRITTANRMFYEMFRLEPAEVIGQPLAEIGGKIWAIPELLSALANILPEHTELKAFEITREFPGLGSKVLLLNARKLYRVGNGTTMMLLAIEDITDRKLAESRLQEANVSLRARTVELEGANRELEAFSYSVSHDLRAPLRHIDYFSTTLQKQIPPEHLDAKAQRSLSTITTSARSMGQLIDDLLSFARIGRAEIRHSQVSLDELVAETRQSLQTEVNGRALSWSVAPLPAVAGDPALLRQVFANLLSNAVKYTRRCPEARIEIGTQPGAEGDVVVYVRDNGAGFDMKYADKLFGVFQRLHSAKEFEGTGVGLANVRRIIERHGGRIWAEAAVNRGATFFFTLPVARTAV
ncbi:MAG: ATP-binding protein [Verrucomicrobiota bacterium]